jgi:predicted nucleic acid-binding protein
LQGRAAVILGRRPRISVQVLTETLVNGRRKAGLCRDATGPFPGALRALCPIEDLTQHTHDAGRALADRDGFSIDDALIVACP